VKNISKILHVQLVLSTLPIRPLSWPFYPATICKISIIPPPTSLPSSWRPYQAPDPCQSQIPCSVPFPTSTQHPHPAPFPTQIPPLLKTRRPSFRDDYTGPIGMNGRFDPLFGDEFPDGTQIPPLLSSLNLGRMGSSARQRSTCIPSCPRTPAAVILARLLFSKYPSRVPELQESGLQQGCKTRAHCGG
jgi:hypothetical protein